MSFFSLFLKQCRVHATALLFTLPTTLLAILLPGLPLRRRVARAGAALTCHLAGMPLHVSGRHFLPDGPCVVVANHASYLDGLLLMGVLPPKFTFLIKTEIQRTPLIGLLLKRLGMAFVARGNAKASAGAATRLIMAVKQGEAMAVFPEGTFVREAGIRPFRLGAFVAAARAGAPIVPVSINGTRAIFPAGARLFNTQCIEVSILPPVSTGLSGHAGVAELATLARSSIASHHAEATVPRHDKR